MTKWRDIGSAPHDGTDILCWCLFGDREGVRIVLSWDDRPDWPGWPWADWDGNRIHESVPKKWQPLPEPPT